MHKFQERFYAGILLFSTALMLVWVFYYLNYGMSFTDESGYFVSISNPWHYTATVSQYAFVYHPVFILVKGSIALLRQVNLFIIYALTCVLVWLFFNQARQFKAMQLFTRIAIVGATSTISLLSMIHGPSWLPTPSYNTLAFQSLLTVAIGMLLANRQVTRTSLIGYALIGLGGFFAFMAKPTTAATLGIVVLVYLLAVRRINIYLLLMSVIVSAVSVCMTAYLIDGSLTEFIHRMTSGVHIANSIIDHRAMWRIDSLELIVFYPWMAVIVLGLIVMVTCFVVKNPLAYLLSMTMAFGLVLSIVALIFFEVLPLVPYHIHQNTLMLFMIIPIFALLLISKKWKVSWNDAVLAFVLFIFPHVYALGTNNNYWLQGGSVAFFWALSGFVLLRARMNSEQDDVLVLPFALGAQALAVALVASAMSHPYGQPEPLQSNTQLTQIGSPSSHLILSETFAQYIRDARNFSAEAGFVPGTPVIDLTGMSSGTIFAMQGVNTGLPWVMSVFSKNAIMMQTILGKASCEELAKAWVLIEPESHTAISSDSLSGFGANLNSDYELAANLEAPSFLGVQPLTRGSQSLMKPVRPLDQALQSCLLLRANG